MLICMECNPFLLFIIFFLLSEITHSKSTSGRQHKVLALFNFIFSWQRHYIKYKKSTIQFPFCQQMDRSCPDIISIWWVFGRAATAKPITPGCEAIEHWWMCTIYTNFMAHVHIDIDAQIHRIATHRHIIQYRIYIIYTYRPSRFQMRSERGPIPFIWDQIKILLEARQYSLGSLTYMHGPSSSLSSSVHFAFANWFLISPHLIYEI